MLNDSMTSRRQNARSLRARTRGNAAAMPPLRWYNLQFWRFLYPCENSRTRRRSISRSVTRPGYSPSAELSASPRGTNAAVPTRRVGKGTSYSRHGEAPSTVPLHPPAREIRYEVYPCIFENRWRFVRRSLVGAYCARRAKLYRPIYSAVRVAVS